MKQQTLCKDYSFEGKGLHTGRYAHMCLKPAPEGTGIVFIRTDAGKQVRAVAENVSSTARSTTLTEGNVSIRTVEHVLSALTGLGVDNAFIEIDNREVPILDGSALPYVQAIAQDGLVQQDAERRWIELKETVELRNANTGSFVRFEPADGLSYEVTIDFDSKVLGVQTAKWSFGENYTDEVAPCRTFCFLHEIQLLATLGMVKGGDVENAIVVVEKPISDRKLSQMARHFGQPQLKVTPEGYLSNLVLRFPDECGRHKLLDIMGDLRLCGGFVKAKITAYKPGHSINTRAAKEVRKKLLIWQ